jgi:plasmid segregation protein ParM
MLVVDLGFSSAKWVYNSKKGRLKSAYRKTKKYEGYLYKGERYVLGERALLETGSYYLRTVEELIRFYPLFTAYSAEKAGIREDEALVAGLPYDFWESETAKIRKGEDSVIDSLKKSLSKVEVNDRIYDFKRIYIYPQGLGGIKAFLEDYPDTQGNVLGIDIGFNSIIYALYSVDESELLHGKTVYKKGIHEMAVNYILPEITQHIPGKTLTPIEINHIIENRNIQVGFDLIDVGPEIDDAANAYIKDIFSFIIGDLKAHGGVITFNTIALFGGGARLVQDKLTSNKVKIMTLKEPEFSNAVGFGLKASEVSGKSLQKELAEV